MLLLATLLALAVRVRRLFFLCRSLIDGSAAESPMIRGQFQEGTSASTLKDGAWMHTASILVPTRQAAGAG